MAQAGSQGADSQARRANENQSARSMEYLRRGRPEILKWRRARRQRRQAGGKTDLARRKTFAARIDPWLGDQFFCQSLGQLRAFGLEGEYIQTPVQKTTRDAASRVFSKSSSE